MSVRGYTEEGCRCDAVYFRSTGFSNHPVLAETIEEMVSLLDRLLITAFPSYAIFHVVYDHTKV